MILDLNANGLSLTFRIFFIFKKKLDYFPIFNLTLQKLVNWLKSSLNELVNNLHRIYFGDRLFHILGFEAIHSGIDIKKN